MLKKTIKYPGYDGQEYEEDFYFNLKESEILEMELGASGGLSTYVTRIVAAKDTPEIMKVFKELILKSYGIKSPDGKRFMKSEEISKSFEETEAYSQLFLELSTDDIKGSEFINGITPNKKEAAKPAVIPYSSN